MVKLLKLLMYTYSTSIRAGKPQGANSQAPYFKPFSHTTNDISKLPTGPV